MKRKLFIYGGAAIALLLFSIVVSLSLGSANLPLSEVWRILLNKIPGLGSLITPDWQTTSETIILKVRLPRLALALVVGAALAVAGAGFQGVLRNPLADPYTLGVATGASVGASVIILTGMQTALGQWTVPLVAFVTGILTLVIVFRLAGTQGVMRLETLILSGVVVQAFLGAFVSFMVTLSKSVVNEILFWQMGSVAMRGWSYSGVVLPYLLVGTAILLYFGRSLNLLALGERQAAHLGVNVSRTRLVVLIVSTLMTAAAVSVSGVVAFVGLVIPHLVRLVVGPDYRLIIPLSTIVGSVYLIWADTLARLVLSPKDIPLGIVTALLGAPFFAYLLSRQKKRLSG
ncbi:FecCD family ABC transporter permease [Paenibacillus contaminans]|uniref:Iron ABC transporter permease n=1 Tax=Paenibacillus contaminans TaxID=450362 RepID=A0A329M014_9BACL|nr:iron ABC transporter permease [Paenibacillus contaminans]RAV12950.1 iron ABC transporter permease [Paenibacillus contaminans]